MKKLAIIGASYLQEPLIRKAKDKGIETHVFAWECGDIGEEIADYFYPISITEKELILQKCKEIQIDGICSIASDLATIAVNYVANEMGLVGNSLYCTHISTNKYAMRKCFQENAVPSPKYLLVSSEEDLEDMNISFPVIVKPTDRSGSRGVTKVLIGDEIENAVERAKSESFEKRVLVEEFVEGEEYSVECISFRSQHYFLAITKKYTTGSPFFIETGHLQPALLGEEMLEKVKNVVFNALDSLQIENSASHTEIKIDEAKNIKVIEVGARMGGDCIGSDLVPISTGVDFVEKVIEIALGQELSIVDESNEFSAIRYILSKEDVEALNTIKRENPQLIVREYVEEFDERIVTDSSKRYGYFIMKSKSKQDIEKYMP